MKKLLFLLVTILIFSCSQDSGDIQPVINGSYSKMLTVGNYLYAINKTELSTYNIENPSIPVFVDKQDVGFNIENVYHNLGVLFIGSETALHIFEINTKGVPIRKSETSYFRSEGITSCDPVISDGNLAYVTLSTASFGSSRCRRTVQINELRIYDIENINSPVLLSTTHMEGPKGIALKDKYLFVCEDYAGLKIVDVSNPSEPVIISKLEGFRSYDVIVKNDILMIVCPTEIRQYDFSDIENIEFLSSLKL